MITTDEVFELGVELQEVERSALELAERLALRVLDRPGFDAHVVGLASALASQTKLVHRLRREYTAAVAG